MPIIFAPFTNRAIIIMNRLNATLLGLLASVLLGGCASEPTTTSAAPAATAKAAAPAMSDTEMAAKLVGTWEGKWSIAQYNGKFVLVVTGVEGANVKGEAQWYETAAGNTKEQLKTATVKNGELVAEQTGGAKFKLRMKSATAMQGKWDNAGFVGDLEVTKK